MPLGGSGAYQPPRERADGRRDRGPAGARRSPTRPTGGACSISSRPTRPPRMTTCGGPGSRDATDLPLLDARAAARTHYDAVVASAGDWQLPRTVRDAMRAWRFDQAQTLLDDAVRILEQRTAIATAAAASGLTASSNLRTAFESADQFANATVEGAAELVAIDRFDRAAATRPASPDVLQVVGLLGTAPDADLDRARSLFTAGDLGGSTEAAGVAAAAWSGAADVGRNRLVGSAAVVLTVLVGLALIVAWLRGRRRRRRDGSLACATGRDAGLEAGTPRSVDAAWPSGAGGTRTLHSPPLRTRPSRSRSETIAREERSRTDGPDALAAVARDPVGRLG